MVLIFVLACALLALAYGVASIRWLLAKPTGSDAMLAISQAIQEGASAYLNRQYTTIAIVGAVLFVAIWFLLDSTTAIGFAIGAAALLFQQFGTGDLETIFNGLQVMPAGALPATVEGAAALIAVAAILKSAQFPTHSWLVEVMETPTPVSALLHAGILNAGPFLAVRLSFVLEQATVAPLLLIAFGAFTALFASKALLTQHSIKVGLGYSSAAHMGFMLMICGLGVYAAAILHLVAHSFYKAHAFLSSLALESTNSRMSGWSESRMTILAARRVLPPDLTTPAKASKPFMKLTGPLAMPPPDIFSLEPRMGERFTPAPEPYLKSMASVLARSMIDDMESCTELMKQAEHCGLGSTPTLNQTGLLKAAF